MSEKKKKQQGQAAKTVTDAPKPPKNKDLSHLRCFSTPGLSQAQVMARIGDVQHDSESLVAIMKGVIDRTKNGQESDIEMILHSQIAMLNSLAAHFMVKALGGYDSPEVLRSLPQIPSEFANLSLKCQEEMRRCIALLHEIKNPKKPSQFIKNYVNNQINSLQVEQQELRERLEASNSAQMDYREPAEASGSYQEVATVATVNGSGHAIREGD